MPYSKEQCAAFAAKAARGERVPDDWREHCRERRVGERRKGGSHSGPERRSGRDRRAYPRSHHARP